LEMQANGMILMAQTSSSLWLSLRGLIVTAKFNLLIFVELK
jgi:hypothetical protein